MPKVTEELDVVLSNSKVRVEPECALEI